jgi:hypothetical protein
VATTPKTTPAKTTKPAEDQQDAAKPDDTKTSEASYGERAVELGGDTRTIAEAMRDQLDDLTERIGGLRQTAPGQFDAAAADGVGRLPMAIDGVRTALDGLVHVAAELAVKAQQGGA